jgi:outer membrane protein OmpA-like peptidoglycan-associated protein
MLSLIVIGAMVCPPDFAATCEQDILPTDHIHFAFDSSRLDPVDREQARVAARWLVRNPDKRIVLEGHADHIGTTDYNVELGSRRATAVRAWMLKAGAPFDRIVIANLGEGYPRSTDDENNRQVVLYATDAPVAKK